MTSSPLAGGYSSRRTLLRAAFASPLTTSTPDTTPITRAIATHRRAVSDLRLEAARCEKAGLRWGDDAPGTPGHRRMIRAEGLMDQAVGVVEQAARAVLDEMERSGLKAFVQDSDLFVVADLEPESVRRLIVVPAHGIGGRRS